jgi:ankyrin repeat protein
MTVLHYLASRKFEDEKLHLQLLGELIEKGLDVNHNKGANQETPLQYAVARGQITPVKFLLERGADVNAVNK